MSNLYKIEKSKENLEKLFSKRYNKKDYEGALCVLNTMRNLYIEDVFLMEKYAITYFQIEEYNKAVNYWYLYLSKCDKNSREKAYNGLGACFYKMENNDLASHYFNEQLKGFHNEKYLYNDLISDFYDDITDVKSNYYIAYPYDKANFDKLLNKILLYVKSGYYEEALKELEIIPENSKYYVDALIQKSLCYFLMGEYEVAIKFILEAVDKDNDNIIATFNAISMLYSNGKTLECKELLNLLENSKSYLDEENFEKIAMIYCEVKDYNKAELFLDKTLKITPLKFNVLTLMGITKFNLKKYGEALEIFNKLNRINPSYIYSYYVKLISNAIKNSNEEKNVKALEYSFDLQRSDYNKIVKKLNEISILEKIENKHYKKVTEILDYAFSVPDLKLQMKSLKLINKLDAKFAFTLTEKYLIKVETFDTVKRSLIAILIEKGYEGKLYFTFGNVFRTLDILLPYFERCNLKILKDAYAILISKIAPLEKDITKIYLATNNIIDILGSDSEEIFDDVFSLSAVIYEFSNIKQIKSRRSFLDFFGANQRTVKRYKELILLKDVTSNDELQAFLEEIAVTKENKDDLKQ